MPTATRRPFAPVPALAEQRTVRMRDGIRLATDLYLPGGAGPWPTLLCRLPYDKAGEECFTPWIAEWFVGRGYAVVLQDCRGKVRSDGAPRPFTHEAADGRDTIDWIAGQPWSTGRVGMFGDSYYGFTQWAAAAARPPALAAITPRGAPFDYRKARFRQGVLALETVLSYAVETWVDEALYDCEPGFDWGLRPLRDVAVQALGGRVPAGLDDWAVGRFPRASAVPVTGDVPALQLAGFWDPVHRQGVDAWQRASRRRRSGAQHLLLDARDHGWTQLRPHDMEYVDPMPDAKLRQAFLDDYLEPITPFLDDHVAGRSAHHAPPVRYLVTGSGWSTSPTWPPQESLPRTWYPSARGGLAERPDRTAAAVRWPHDPSDPVPSGEHCFFPLIHPYLGTATRPDVLRFETPPLEHPVDLVGPAHLRASVVSSAPSTHLCARVWDVSEETPPRRILEGAALVRGPWPRPCTVDLGHTGYRLEPGHRMRLEISTSCFPMYALHPGNDAEPWTASRFDLAESRIETGGATPASLTMQVLPGGTP